MGDQQGVLVRPPNFYNAFHGKDVPQARWFLQRYAIDVNACTIDAGMGVRTSPMVYAVINFDPTVMLCLLNEFGADLNAPCYQDGEDIQYLLDYALCGPGTVEKATEATGFLLDHGASPFMIPGVENHYGAFVRSGMMLVNVAKERCYTAWAAHWTLSHDPCWRDMADQVARCIMATPVREFLEDEENNIKRRKVTI